MLKTRNGRVVGTGVGDDQGGDLLDDRDIIYTRAEAANYLRKSVPTLERWGRQKIGPPTVKRGPRGVGYTLRSLREATGTVDV